MTSLGTGFDLLLARGALCALGLAALWGLVVVGTAAAEALSDGRVQIAGRIGCPPAVRVWLVGVFVAVFAGIAPAHAGDTGSGDGTSAPLGASVDGLPLPDRAVGGTRHASTTYVVRPGDSLWSIARRVLGPGASNALVADAVARLHSANRSVIGPDPDLLQPGQRLSTEPIAHQLNHANHQEER